ncbi:MAG: CBS domain-containing protein [Flavobacteriales bacterium]|nr:CBS domain-containing protein [Flavobacteriales bacterium]
MKAPENFKTKKLSNAELNPAKSITVDQYMTRNLITFRPHQSIREVMDTLVKKNISGGPVVDDTGRLVGIISEGDCLKQVVKAKYHNLPEDNQKVEDHMERDVKTISPDKDVFEAARQFLNMKIRRFPVLDNGKLIGQVSQKDIMKAVMKLSRNTWR